MENHAAVQLIQIIQVGGGAGVHQTDQRVKINAYRN